MLVTRSPKRSLVFLSASAFALLVAPLANATPEGEEVRPPTWDMSVEELREIGLGQYRGDPIPVPDGAPRLRDPQQPPIEAKQGIIFVNFDGANLSSGSDDSRVNRTQISQLAGSFSSYGQGSKRDATMQAVREDWNDFNVIVTESRPGSGDYTMNMTGPTNPFGGGVLGIAPLDCNDSQTHNNITYAFHSANDQFSASTQATTIGQEVAHSYGLEHVNEPGDIMNPYNAGGDPSFRNECISIDSGGQGIVCNSQHAANCPSGQQNSYLELMNLFGPSTPDTEAPMVQITNPADGDTFPAGSDFDITVTATDDQAIQEVRLYVNGNAEQADTTEPYGWGVTQIPEGTYMFQVMATDVAGNEAMSNVVSIGVGGADPTTSGSDSDSGGTSDSGTTGDSASGTDSGDSGAITTTESDGLPPGFGNERDEDGCACTTAPRAPGPWAMTLMLVGLVFRRRRP